MKKQLLYISLCWLSNALYAKPFTFYDHVQPILNKHCIVCHRPQGPAPFSLLDFDDVYKRAATIRMVVTSRYMPPWRANPLFSHFYEENFLSQQEIETIVRWIAGGKRKGVPKPAANKQLASLMKIPVPDLSLTRDTAYVIPGDNQEHFKIFVLPTRLPKPVFVNAVEYVPGNQKITHHSRIMLDTTQLLRADDGIEVGASSEFQRLGVQLADPFWKGWVPGNLKISYPKGIAKLLPANTDLVINVHYAPAPVPAADPFKINLYFSKEPPQRIVQTFILDERQISNPPFVIPANKVVKFYMRSPQLPTDISLISILPHMHRLGTRFKAYAIAPEGAVIPLIDIPRWDFNWQRTYVFPHLLKLTKGTVIYAEATYDNTMHNTANPFYPPRTAYYGWNTTNEMMNLVFEFVPYQAGDENITPDSQ